MKIKKNELKPVSFAGIFRLTPGAIFAANGFAGCSPFGKADDGCGFCPAVRHFRLDICQ
ncbi:MAG TPA: hypothetical protein VK400_10945 [Pyrinomonadaceae bacterium]|nr:hypothetical protein [Pyrinomonadaceae bacterium]